MHRELTIEEWAKRLGHHANVDGLVEEKLIADGKWIEGP